MTISSSLGSRLETVATLIHDITEMAYTEAWRRTQQHSYAQREIDGYVQSIWLIEKTAEVHGIKKAHQMYLAAVSDVSTASMQEEEELYVLFMLEPWPGTAMHEVVTAKRHVAERFVGELGVARCITLEQKRLLEDLKAKAEADGVPFVLPDIEWNEGVFTQPVAETQDCIIVVTQPWPGVSMHEIVRMCEADAREVVKNGWGKSITMKQAEVLMSQYAKATHPRPRFHVELRNGCLVHRAGKRVKAG